MASPSADVIFDVQTHPITEPQPAIPPSIRATHPAGPKTGGTNNHPRDAPTQQPADSDYRDKQGDKNAQRGENYGDSSGRLWMMYLSEAEKEDKEITENWKVDTEGILVFTGLFSATVASFIIESYKQLSPDSGGTTNALLTQISQQLPNTSNLNGIPLTSVATQNSPSFKLTASAVRVNVMCFLSLVLSLTCALSATLMQHGARRYLQLAQHRGAPHKLARIRAYIFYGTK
ncbi:hypothetical protein EDB85DRAFT_597820 [Lactarius pseudohatsudake]|nr:hypothetical protein EDB85DRAFT_597820 [Lactarius pseudohatsudake]